MGIGSKKAPYEGIAYLDEGLCPLFSIIGFNPQISQITRIVII